MSPMVIVKDLTRSFGQTEVLRGVSLEIEKGEIVAVMGSSGGGKTTLLRCISGLTPPTSGSVTVGGVDVAREPEVARRSMGMVFQSAALLDYMNVGDNVLFGIRRRLKVPRGEQVRIMTEALRVVGLSGSESLMPAELSGGMRKRVGISRALALNPEVMLYDEPTTGLDPITSYTIDSLISEVRQSHGMTSLVVSHDVSSVFRIADRIAFLDHGELTFIGDPGQFERSKDGAIQELVQKSRATTLD